MTRATRALATAALVALALPATALGARRDCWPTGSRTLARTDHARVYTVRDGDAHVAYACLYSAGRRIQLDYDPDEGSGDRSFAPYRLAGRYLAHLGTFVPIEPYDRNETYVRVVDLRDGRIVRDSVSWRGDDEPVTDPADHPQAKLRALEVSQAGRAAWISNYFEDREVWRLDSRGGRRLDRGRGSAVRALDISRTRVTWQNGDARKSASFR
jgi:hypothetical protein